jgi:hypothetical protein
MGKRILISGSMAGHAVGYGGNTWAFLQSILGFRHLGFDVYIEEVDSNYARHAAAAAAFAREYLDSDRVLMQLWEVALASTPGARPA